MSNDLTIGQQIMRGYTQERERNGMPPPSLISGHYVMIISCEDQKPEAERIMHRNGCKQIRFDDLPDGRISAHGFL